MAAIGFIGSGKIGSQLARLAVGQGHDVVLSNSRGPETLRDLVAELGPHARAGTSAEAAAAADVAVVTIPLRAIDTVPVEPLAGKVVIDTSNYYSARDGQISELDSQETTVSELLQRHLPTSKVVKAFNHIMFSQLTTDGQPAGTPGRRALVVAGDDSDARATVAQLIDSFGFDVLELTSLAESWQIQKDTPGYGARETAETLRAALAAAKRDRDM